MILLHDISLYVLYFLLLTAFYLAVERSIFLLHTSKELKRIKEGLNSTKIESQKYSEDLTSILLELLDTIKDFDLKGEKTKKEESIESGFIRISQKFNARLWIIDTIITIAPLLGLLGTILGIFDTFTTLAQSGMSDPQKVSLGIGMALVATAIGIATALLCIIIYNGFQAWVEKLMDEVKQLILAS